MHGGERVRARPERIFVRGELDDPADAELALELLDGFARHVGRERAHAVDREISGIHQATARGYEPNTRNSEARFFSAASAFATCASSACPSMSKKNT